MRGSAFFEGIRQIELEIGGHPGKLPVFYYDGRCMTALFAARYGALRALLPGSRYVPARLAPGVGVVSITCLEYRDCDIGPYNELAVGVLLNERPYRENLPGWALIASRRDRRMHAFIRHLPVTTDVALRGGVDFYNFPKFIAAIDFQDSGGLWQCRLAEGDEHILTLTGTRIATPRYEKVDLFCRLWMDGQPQTAQFRRNHLEVGTTARRGAARLELATRHPIALELDRLLVSRTPLQFEYVPRMEAILFGPEHLTLPLVQRGLRAADALQQREPAR